MPELDAASARGRRFTNFHSIGYATVNGLVGILGGLDIWSPFCRCSKERRSIPPGVSTGPCRAFGEFLQALDDSGFFEHGTLVVVSDHRSMTPVPKEELEHFGAVAISRVPAFAIGNAIPPGSLDDRVFSQGDLVPTFELWLSGAARLDPQDAVMLGETETRKCAFHERGDRRGVLLVICPEGEGDIYLDGDSTRFTQDSGLTESRRQSILATVARERLAGLRRLERTESGGE